MILTGYQDYEDYFEAPEPTEEELDALYLDQLEQDAPANGWDALDLQNFEKHACGGWQASTRTESGEDPCHELAVARIPPRLRLGTVPALVGFGAPERKAPGYASIGNGIFVRTGGRK